jgi:hypothetical protein
VPGFRTLVRINGWTHVKAILTCPPGTFVSDVVPNF